MSDPAGEERRVDPVTGNILRSGEPAAGEGRVEKWLDIVRAAYAMYEDRDHEGCMEAVAEEVAHRLRAVEEERDSWKHVVKIRNEALDKVEEERDAAQAEARRLQDKLSLARSALRHEGLAEHVIEARLRLPDEGPGGA